MPETAHEALPDGLLDAFWRYDAALLANDRDALNELFLPGEHTLRGDGRGVLVGHAAIAGFRSARAAIPTRRVERVHAHVISPDAALLMAQTRDGAATGLQTQVWRRVDGRWAVAAAHVTLPAKPASPPPALDRSIWRVVGDPLAPPSGDGPLAGLGIAVKDLFAVAGQPIGAGVPAYLAEQTPRPTHAPALAALLAAGAHAVGIARTDEFAYSLAGANPHYGTPPNPAHPDAISGGSSSGPAAAVALGQAEIGLGTDTAGSIRVPASYQGLVGLRPTHCAVSAADVLPLAPSFDTVGWLTRDLRTCALVADVLLPRGAATAPRRTLRVAELEQLTELDIRAGFDTEVDALVAEGALPPVEWADLDHATLESWFTAFRTVQAYEAWQAHGAWISAHPDALGPDVAARFAAAAQVTEAVAEAARETARRAAEQIRDLIADTVFVLPSAATAAPPRNASTEQVEAARAATLRLTCIAGLAGAPALSLPRLSSGQGHPVGLCLIGAPGTEHALLELASRMPERTKR